MSKVIPIREEIAPGNDLSKYWWEFFPVVDPEPEPKPNPDRVKGFLLLAFSAVMMVVIIYGFARGL